MRELETGPCRKLDTETMGLERVLGRVVDIELAEWATLRVDAAGTGSVEWVMERGTGRRLVEAAAQETLLWRSAVAAWEAQERRRAAVGTGTAGTALAARENGRVCVSHGVREELGRLLGQRVPSWGAVAGIRRADSKVLLSKTETVAGSPGCPVTIASWMSRATLS